MLRLTVIMVVLIALPVPCHQLVAQHHAPLRNLGRWSAVGWAAGYHVKNPGPQANYYSPWNSSNTSSFQGDDSMSAAPGIINATPFFHAPAEPTSPAVAGFRSFPVDTPLAGRDRPLPSADRRVWQGQSPNQAPLQVMPDRNEQETGSEFDLFPDSALDSRRKSDSGWSYNTDYR
jgi:hypothetical protein